MAEAFLDHRQRLVVIAAFGIEEAVGGKPRLIQCRGEQIASLEHPQHHAFQPGGDPGGKQGRCSIIAERAARARNLVQRRRHKAAPQLRIHCLNPERQSLGRDRQTRCLKGPDLRSKRLQRVNGMALHSDSDDSFVHFMFPS